MAAASILYFYVMRIWPFRRVDSVAFVFCTKFGSNVCYSYWERRTYASDVHLMTSRELTFRVNFWSRGHIRMAVIHIRIKHGTYIFIQFRLIDFFWNSRWRPPPSWIFRLCEFGYSGVLTVWFLCSVPNWVKIYALVSEIDAFMLQTFSWWRHAK